VLVAAGSYASWAAGAAAPGLGSVRATGAAVLALGFVASATAVVPTFEQLLNGNRVYLLLMSLLGVVALVGGLQAVLAKSAAGLAMLMTTTLVLWLIATAHHILLARTTRAVLSH
jgi:hypothetical protein